MIRIRPRQVRTSPRAIRVLALPVLGAAVLFAASGCGSSNKQQQTSQGTGSGATATTSPATTTPATTSQAAPAARKGSVRLGKSAYQKTMRALGNRLGKSVDSLYPLASGSKGSDIAKRTVVKLQKSRAIVNDVLARLQQIVPPPPVAKEHRLLVAGVRLLDTQLQEMITDTETGNVAGFVNESNFTLSLQEINAAANAMTDRGYNIIGKDAAINP